MKRRSFLLATTAAGAAAASGAELRWKPGDTGGAHDAYFARLNDWLKREGPGHPVMLIDLDRMNHNIDVLASSVGPKKTYRVVAKSLPSVPLLAHVMQRAKSTALMSFHQPFLNVLASSFPDSDILLGKPMPLRAVEQFYRQVDPKRFDAATRVQWLVDTPQRLAQYATLGAKMRINIEIDVGLHRGGVPEPEALDPLLAAIADNDNFTLSGLMGYEPHLTSVQGGLEHPAVQQVLASYRASIGRLKEKSAGIDVTKLRLNGAGSHTLRIYERDDTMNDLSAGSAVMKPTDFDTFHLTDAIPSLFIATPVLKRYDRVPFPGTPDGLKLYYIYGGYWMA